MVQRGMLLLEKHPIQGGEGEMSTLKCDASLSAVKRAIGASNYNITWEAPDPQHVASRTPATPWFYLEQVKSSLLLSCCSESLV